MTATWRPIAMSIWREPRYTRLSERARLVYLGLIAGPLASSLPGLVAVGPLAIAEELVLAPEAARSSLDDLVRCRDPFFDEPSDEGVGKSLLGCKG